MNRIISLFLFIFIASCLNGQYNSPIKNKVTLGKQTTADGLVWRGRTSDTVNLMTNKLDTSVYIVLDTGTRAMWYYRASTTPKWTRLVDSLNNLQGTLSVAKGGTGSTAQNFVDLTTTQSIGGDKTFTSAVVGARFNPNSSTASGNGMFLPTTNTLAFSTAGVNRLQINPNGRVGIGTTTLTGILNIKEVGSELSIQTDANNVYFEGINRENTALSVDYGFYARNGNHRFWTGQYTERMTILNNGNVGIGTASPTARLHVKGVDVTDSNFALKVEDSNNLNLLSVKNNGDVTLKNPLLGSNGGTGITTFGAVGRIPYASSTTVLTTSSNLLYDGTRLRTNQVAIGDTASSNVGNVNLLSLSGGSGAGFTLKSSYDSPILRSFTFLINALGNVGFWNNNLLSYAYFIQNSNNYLGVGNSSPTERLHVTGNARIEGLANASNPVNVQVDVNGVLVRTSSIDIKEDVQSLPYGLNELMLLKPSKFSYIDKYKYGESYDIGFIAQDVNNVIPEAVGTGTESDIFMDSVKLIPVLTKAIQEQQALIKALEQRILILENK